MHETRLNVTNQAKNEWLKGCGPESKTAIWFCATQRARLAAERLERTVRSFTVGLKQDVNALIADPEMKIDKYSGNMLTRDADHASQLSETLLAALYEIEQALLEGETDDKKETENEL